MSNWLLEQIDRLRTLLVDDATRLLPAAAEVADQATGGLISLPERAWKAVEDRETALRLRMLHALVMGENADAAAMAQQFSTIDQGAVYACAKLLLDDEEREKAWAYAALLRWFAQGRVKQEDRVRFLRLVRELTSDELESLGDPTVLQGIAWRERLANILPGLQAAISAALDRWGFAAQREGPGCEEAERRHLLVTILNDGKARLESIVEGKTIG